MGIKESARRLGLETERPPRDTAVITAYAQETTFGDTRKTWESLLEGKSGGQEFPVKNFRTNIAAPFEDPYKDFNDTREQRATSRVAALAIKLSREAGIMRGIIGEDGRLLPTINKNRVGVCISSGIGASQQLIDAYNTIHGEVDKEGNEDMVRGSSKVTPFAGLRLFPEQINAQVAKALGCSGWPINTSEACATGLASIIEAVRLVEEGRADLVFAGGVEDVLHEYPEVTIALFASLRGALSTRNEDPEKASRPFDKDRDGFLISSGGGITIVESMQHAIKRGAEIQAVVLGYDKSIDGKDLTNLDTERVATTIQEASRIPGTEDFYIPDVFFAHATSTKSGDDLESQALRLTYEEDLDNIYITAIKGGIGHTLGAAGAVNAVNTVLSVKEGKIPPIANSENVDKNMQDLKLVRGKPIEKQINIAAASAYGFGGHNSVLILGNPKTFLPSTI